MNERNDEVRRLVRTLGILWGSFLIAAVVYMIVGTLIARGHRHAAEVPGAAASLKPIFYALGGVLLLASFFVRRQLMGRAYREPYAAMLGIQAAMVVGWAMSEAVAILGLVLVLIGGPLTDAVPFVAVAFVAIALQRPDGDGVRRRLDASQ